MSPTDLPRLVFVFPYHGVGGVSMLFLRIAEFLAEHGLARTALVDYPDGFMATHRRPHLTELIAYSDTGRVHLPSDALAVFQSMTPWSIFPGLSIPPGMRLLFWNCHPFNLVPTLPGVRQRMQASPRFGRRLLKTLLRPYRSKMLRLIDILLAHHSLVFMDKSNVRTTERFLDVKIPEPVYLPIPCTPADATIAPPPGPPSVVRVGWVGRLVDFKYHVLWRALQELAKARRPLGIEIEVTIVGTGEYADVLRDAVASLPDLTVRFVDHCPPAQLDALMSTFDMLVAMGTSALDGGKLGIPTLLLDFSYQPVPEDYRFEWLHTREGFCLAEMIDSEHLGAPGSMAARLRELIAHRGELRHAVAQYVHRNHDLATVCANLLTIGSEASCTWNDLLQAKVTGRGMAYGAFAALRRTAGR